MTAVAELAERWEGIELPAAAARRAHAVLDRLGSSESGLVPEEASVRLAAVGPNAVVDRLGRRHGLGLNPYLARMSGNPTKQDRLRVGTIPG